MSKRPTYQWLHLMGDYLPSFLDKLEREGFAIGIEKQLRIQEVLRKLPENTPLDKIKTSLCPLIASNEKEQVQFYDLFEAHFPKTTDAPKPKPEPPAIEIPKPDITPYVVGTFFALLLITAINFYFNNPFQEDDTPVIIENPQPETPIDTIFQDTTTQMPKSIEMLEEDINRTQWNELIDFYYDNKWFVKIFLFSFMLLLMIVYELYQRRKQQLIGKRVSGNKPPFIWGINPDTAIEIGYGEQFDTALHRLRTRELGAQVRLDMSASIGATTRQGGIIELQYKANTRPSEYLLLIDRNTNKSHQAQLFNRIYQDLRDNEVYVERFFYEGDPRICWNEHQHTGIGIAQLAAKYSDYRLLLFGNASRLINPRTGQIQQWAEVFDTWHHKAIFTPSPRAAWQHEELLLAEEFIVLPSNVEGIIQAVNQFETGKRSDLLLQQTPNLRQKQSIHIDETQPLVSLKQHFDEPIIQWIAACAIYPELNWDLTLHIGELLSTEENDLLRLENLLSISQLEWFQLVEMPDEVRAELLAYLPENITQYIRTSIIELLKQNPPPPDSHAYDDYRMQLLVQELLLTPDQRQKQKEQELVALSQAVIEQDFTILKYLDRHKSKLDFLIPNDFKSTFFKRGHAFFGLRSWVYWILFGMLITAVFWEDFPEFKSSNKDVALTAYTRTVDSLEVLRIVTEAIDLEFAAYKAVPEYEVYLDSLQAIFWEDESAYNTVMEILVGQSELNWILNNTGNPSSNQLLNISLYALDDKQAVVSTEEFWHIKWYSRATHEYEYLYKLTNTQKYTLTKDDALGWKILINDYEFDFYRKPPMVPDCIYIINESDDFKKKIYEAAIVGNAELATRILDCYYSKNTSSMPNEVLEFISKNTLLFRHLNTDVITEDEFNEGRQKLIYDIVNFIDKKFR